MCIQKGKTVINKRMVDKTLKVEFTENEKSLLERIEKKIAIKNDTTNKRLQIAYKDNGKQEGPV